MIFPSKKFVLAAAFLAALVLAVFLAYRPAFRAPFYFDDNPNIVDNQGVHYHPGSVGRQVWDSLGGSFLRTRPLAYITFGFNYLFFGLDPYPFRLVNVAIHLITALLVFLLARSLLGLPGAAAPEAAKRWAPYGVSLLFALHPTATQSVTYIVQRMNSLMTLFYLAGMILCIASWGRRGAPRWARLGGGALCFVLAAGCKEVAATFPFVLLFIYLFLYRGFDSWAGFLRDRPVFIATLATLAAGVAGLAYLTLLSLDYGERGFTMAQRLLTQLRVIPYYAGLFALPLPGRLRLIYDWPVSRSLLSPPSTIAGLAFILACLSLMVWSLRRDRIVSLGIFWFFFTLLPESSVLNLELVFEHRLYLPSFGLALLAAWGAARLASRLGTATLGRPRLAAVPWLALAAAIGLFTWWTWSRNALWADPEAFIADNLAKSPGEARLSLGMSEFLMAAGKYPQAASFINRGLAAKPNRTTGRGLLTNLAICLTETGDYTGAEAALRRALAEYGEDRKVVYNLGVISYLRDRPDEALRWLGTLSATGEMTADAWYYTGLIRYRTGLYGQAHDDLRRALELDGRDAAAWQLLGLAAYRLQRWDEALADWETARGLGAVAGPEHLFAAGVAHLRAGRLAAAANDFRRYLSLVPGDPQAWYNLACVHARADDVSQALAALKEALDGGFSDWGFLAADPDLASLRGVDGFRALLERGRGRP